MIYEKQCIGYSKVDITLYTERVVKKIQVTAGTDKDTVFATLVDAAGETSYRIYRDNQLFGTFSPPKGMTYLSIKAINEGSQFIGLLVSKQPAIGQSRYEESYFQYLRLDYSGGEMLQQYVKNVGASQIETLNNMVIGEQMTSGELMVLWPVVGY